MLWFSCEGKQEETLIIQQLLTHSHVTTGSGKLTHIGQLYQNDTQSASTEDLVKFDKERISVIYNNLGGRRLHNVKYAQANAQMAMSKHVCPISDATPDPRQRQKGLT